MTTFVTYHIQIIVSRPLITNWRRQRANEIAKSAQKISSLIAKKVRKCITPIRGSGAPELQEMGPAFDEEEYASSLLECIPQSSMQQLI